MDGLHHVHCPLTVAIVRRHMPPARTTQQQESLGNFAEGKRIQAPAGGAGESFAQGRQRNGASSSLVGVARGISRTPNATSSTAKTGDGGERNHQVEARCAPSHHGGGCERPSTAPRGRARQHIGIPRLTVLNGIRNQRIARRRARPCQQVGHAHGRKRGEPAPGNANKRSREVGEQVTGDHVGLRRR